MFLYLCFRQVLIGVKSLEEVGAIVYPNIDAGNQFMKYFDDPKIPYF